MSINRRRAAGRFEHIIDGDAFCIAVGVLLLVLVVPGHLPTGTAALAETVTGTRIQFLKIR